MQAQIAKLMQGRDLSADEMTAAFETIMEGGATDAQIGGFLVALAIKGETVEEIAAAARVMRSKVTPILAPADRVVLDTCGTGGDRLHTFNISTAAAIIAAASGATVAKHGNRSVTSACGSAEVLAELGVNVQASVATVQNCITGANIGFCFAPLLHGAMKFAIGPRKQLGVRTIFNILGPLTNPAGAQRQLMGVFTPDLTDFIADVLASLGSKSAMVVCGYGNVDELTTTGPNRISHYDGQTVRTYELDPVSCGLAPAHISALLGGDPPANAHILRGILSGKVNSAKRDVVLLNTAAALIAAGKVTDILEGIAIARDVIESGAALAKLETLIEYTQELAHGA